MLDDWSHISCDCGIPSCEEPVTCCPEHESLVPHAGCTQGDRPALVVLFNHCIHSLGLELATSSTGRQHTSLSEITPAGRQMMCLGGKGRSKKPTLQRRFCDLSSFLQHKQLERNTSPEIPCLVLFRQKRKEIPGAKCHGCQIRTKVPARKKKGFLCVPTIPNIIPTGLQTQSKRINGCLNRLLSSSTSNKSNQK